MKAGRGTGSAAASVSDHGEYVERAAAADAAWFKARYYMIARGSATEVAALLDVLDRRRLASPAAVRTARRLAIRCVQMLSKIDQALLKK